MAIAALQGRILSLTALQDNFQYQILILSNREQMLSYKSEETMNKLLQQTESTDSESSLSDAVQLQYETQMQVFSNANARLETERKLLETQLSKCQADMQSVQSCLDKECQAGSKFLAS